MAGIASFAAGLCAQRALRGRTLASARVLLEPGAPVDVKEPTIVVHTGESLSEIFGRALASADGLGLRFELFLPCGVEVTAGGGTWALETASSLSLPFALFWRQCEIALSADQGAWANLFRALVLNMEMLREFQDFIPLETGMRIAMRGVDIKATTLDSPPIGAAPSGFWADFIAAMRAEGGELASLATLVERMIKGETDLLDWQIDVAALGLSQSYGETLGVNYPTRDMDNENGAAVIEEPADGALTDPQSVR